MKGTVKNLLSARGITLVSPVPLSALTLTRPYLLARHGIEGGTAFMFAVPYYTTACDDPARNISIYAVSRDYHRFFSMLFDEILPILRDKFPQNRFAGFTDHSPIAEGEAAVKAGLGMFGCNHLFLTKEHSSFVFLGEIITDAVLDCDVKEISVCTACGACKRACPVGLDVTRCLSALTQQKGTLDSDAQKALLAHGIAWGCDICQEHCPVTKAAKKAGTLYSTIPFFAENAIPQLTTEMIKAMSDEEFAARAYSWRGREVILRNLALLEGGEML
ncbi:MAG: epoxyqueuosine reductase [Ruminococcaceae bacterium]|nr:epoxyqueuosine reductase [Oscillospiraceae bacterium]